MSDNWITLVPRDPLLVPAAADIQRAKARLRDFVHTADEIVSKVADVVEFHDCGVNLERITCPTCEAEVPFSWWQDRLEEDRAEGGGFKLVRYATPCCGSTRSLNELAYDWPQAFGRLAIDAMNPGVGELAPSAIAELEAILGTRLVVVYQHI